MDSGLRAEVTHYIRELRLRDKSLKNASAQRTDHDLMAMLQHTIKPRVVAKHKTTTYLQATSAQWADQSLMAMLQRMTMPRVVTSWQTDLSPQATSTQ